MMRDKMRRRDMKRRRDGETRRGRAGQGDLGH